MEAATMEEFAWLAHNEPPISNSVSMPLLGHFPLKIFIPAHGRLQYTIDFLWNFVELTPDLQLSWEKAPWNVGDADGFAAR
jgi:hypothetical protein